MELAGRTALLLGGSGLVGRAVARRLLEFGPARLVIVGLLEGEVRDAVDELRPLARGAALEGEWGDIFLPADAARRERSDILADPELRALVVQDVAGELTEQVLQRSLLYGLVTRYRPEIVVDSINTATAFAYQNVYHSVEELLRRADAGRVDREFADRHVLTLGIPALIRHTQIAVEAFRRAGTLAYVKIGTSGTGGMGFNIPFTHSEERPSRMLLTKSAMAGAQSLLLFLLGRTPGAPATIEIKPTAAVGWREIRYGPVRRAGCDIRVVDCPEPQPLARAFGADAGGWRDTGRPLASVYIDMGENGAFARDEFETVSALGSMELVTPEEIADLVIMELAGRPTGRDVVAALDGATAGPTYRAGLLRAEAIERLQTLERRHGVRSVAFEMLGPPRLTKILYEAQVWSQLRASVEALARAEPAALAAEAADLVAQDSALRSTVISVGLPIIVQGDQVYRGELVVVPPDGEAEPAILRGWVDLREASALGWVERARRATDQARGGQSVGGSGSGHDWGAMNPGDPISPPRFAAWIFKHEEGGERIKR
ncbi:MAG TPA: hypothetical protein VF970_15530 [Gemmatimonadales bacterium]